MSTLVLSALFGIGVAGPATPPRYVLEEIKPYGRVWGMNDHGAVVGRAGQRGFIWEAGAVTDLPEPLPGHSYTEGRAITNERVVAYNSKYIDPYVGSVSSVGFFWEDGEAWPARGRLDTLGSEVLSISESEVIYGRGVIDCNFAPSLSWLNAIVTNALFWSNMTGTDARMVNAFAGWVESDAVIASYHLDGANGQPPVLLPTLGGPSTQVNDALSFNESTGWSETATGEQHAFLYVEGTMLDLGPLDGSNTRAAALAHVDSVYVVVGASSRAWVWRLGVMYPLEDRIMNVDVTLIAATDINAHGQIIANVDDPDGPDYGALLTPLPAGDATLDFVVDNDDLLAVMAAWGPCDDRCPADLDGDGVVGQSDLDLVLASWAE